MADERKCFAGDLTSDAIGKTIRFVVGPETARTTYTDKLVAVEHKRERANGTLVPAEFTTVTTLHLERHHWTQGQGLFGLPSMVDVGLDVEHTLIVEVLP